MPKLRPLKDRILVKPEVRVLSSIIAIDNKEVHNTGEVVAVGPGEWLDDGKYIPQQCQVGDKVRFGTMSNDPSKEYLKFAEYVEDGERYLLMSWKDICMVIEE